MYKAIACNFCPICKTYFIFYQYTFSFRWPSRNTVTDSSLYRSTERVTEKRREDCSTGRSSHWKRIHRRWTGRTAGSAGSKRRDSDTSCGGHGVGNWKSAHRDRCHQYQECFPGPRFERKWYHYVILQVWKTWNGRTVTRNEVRTIILILLKCRRVTSWLVRSPRDRAVRVRALAGGYCFVFLGQPLYSHSASLHPGILMGTGRLNAGSNPAMD